MTRLIIDRRGVELEYEADILVIREPAERPRTVPLSRLEQVICMHNVSLSTQLIGQLRVRGIDFITINGRYPEHGFELFADQQKEVTRRCIQYQWQANEAQCLLLAKLLCQHKLRASLKVLKQSGIIDTNALSRCLKAIRGSENMATLRGNEGQAQRVVFDFWKQLLPPELGFRARKRRPPPDPVNALLSLGYTLVMNEAVRQCKKFGLDPALGFYHKASFGRNSLACDIMEPTRPYVEYFVCDLLMRNMITEKHFSKVKAGCYLSKEGRSIFYQAFSSFLQQNRRRIEAPARWLAQKLNSDIKNRQGNEI